MSPPPLKEALSTGAHKTQCFAISVLLLLCFRKLSMSFDYKHIQAATEEEFVSKSTELLEKAILDAIGKNGVCTLGLSGGSTPRATYTRLGASKNIDWSAVAIFLVDERYVPPDHKESNARLVRETLLHSAKIPENQIIFPEVTLPLDACVQRYEKRLAALFRVGYPDVVLLGLGEDGHIASLFPGDVDALLERERNVLHTQTDHFAVRDRITLTLPVLTSAETPLFLLKGEGKKKIFAETLSENTDPIEYPAHALLEAGRTVWVTCF